MPLKVYMHPCDGVAGYDPKFKQSFVDACNGLSSALGNAVAFQFIDTETGADIDVRWVASKQDISDLKWGDAIGLCRRVVDHSDGTVEHASIFILTMPDYANAKKYGKNFMQQTCLHELGHACGLGHSLRKDDVMFKRHSPAVLSPDGELELAYEPHFSERDAASLKLLITAQNKIIDVKESSDRKTACTKFNNEAFRLIREGDNGQALIYLRAALDSDDKDKLAMQNAMVALFNCACNLNNTCHWAEALPILEKSITLAKKVGTAAEMNAMVSVQRNCMTQLAAQRKSVNSALK
jgi:hypothetical protein